MAFGHYKTIVDCDRELEKYPPLSDTEFQHLQQCEQKFLEIGLEEQEKLAELEAPRATATKAAKDAHAAKVALAKAPFDLKRRALARTAPSYVDLQLWEQTREALYARKKEILLGANASAGTRVPPAAEHPGCYTGLATLEHPGRRSHCLRWRQ
ncbi:protein ubiquitination [Pleodorina starrii]|uniref:Protein ubiquitination n=1 Tax=Pleodorina starrii TaxID=330485 RepID=A0A9W6F7Q7_9CHLO|nr:protein ubiquitination [Pleodorina starrii]